MKQLNNPFGVPVHTYIIDQKLNENGEKLGTYGIIKGVSTFLGVSIPNAELAPLVAGYEFENLILYATHLGLSTVWLAATFDWQHFTAVLVCIYGNRAYEDTLVELEDAAKQAGFQLIAGSCRHYGTFHCSSICRRSA